MLLPGISALLVLAAAVTFWQRDAIYQWETRDWSTQRLEQEAAARPDDAIVQRTLGQRLLAGGRPAEALAVAEAARRANDRDPEAWTLYAEAASATGNEQENQEALQHVVRLDPGYAPAYLALARHYQRVGSSQGVIDQARRYATMRPRDASGWELMARAFIELSEPGSARSAALQATRTRPADPEGWALLGSAERMQGDPAAAEVAFREALRRDPHDAPALTGLGTTLLAQAQEPRERVEALGLVEQAVAAAPNDPVALYELGYALMEDGKLRDAVAAWERAVRAAPDDARCHHALAQGLRRLGRTSEAARHWRTFERLRGYDRLRSQR